MHKSIANMLHALSFGEGYIDYLNLKHFHTTKVGKNILKDTNKSWKKERKSTGGCQ